MSSTAWKGFAVARRDLVARYQISKHNLFSDWILEPAPGLKDKTKRFGALSFRECVLDTIPIVRARHVSLRLSLSARCHPYNKGFRRESHRHA